MEETNVQKIYAPVADRISHMVKFGNVDDPKRGDNLIHPAIDPVMQVAKVPEKIDLGASETISLALSAHIPLKPAIIIPKLPKFAKPQIAYVMMIFDFSERVSAGNCAIARNARNSLSTVFIPSSSPT